MSGFLERRRLRLAQWWAAPFKPWERALLYFAAAVYAGIAVTLIGVFSGLIPIFPLERLLLGLLLWVAPAMAIAIALAHRYPKLMFCVLFPFALISGGDISIS